MLEKKAKKGNTKPKEELFEEKVIVPVTKAMKAKLRALAKREGGVPLAQLVRRFVLAGLGKGV